MTLSGVILRAGAIVICGALLGLLLNTVRAQPLDLRGPAGATACEGPGHEPTLLQAREAAQLCAKNNVLIADARSATDFAAGHVAGAIHLPCDASGNALGNALAHVNGHRVVIVYGATTEEAVAVARSIARQLREDDAPTIYALEGGFAAWERAGEACASGPCDGCAANPMSAPR